ncbi:2-oxoacid:ferredoxin oxidoreductase subunit beta [Candidatus Peregrinibacteria bacterium]|nr:2-oxoacid:ferredoxin oxidoreductase subunit beta [Candidatus Peregrinibacteria bacterium]
MRTPKDYTDNTGKPNWCPGCGNFGIEAGLKMAMSKLNLDPDNVALVSGIGCGANAPYWFNTYGLVTLHGRPLPVATGVKLGNHELTVIAWSGDGDAYGIGMGHFIHAMRRNANVTYLVGNNTVYGLTKGQASPTAEKGQISPSTPFGTPDPNIDPLALAMSSKCSFIARGFAGNLPHLSNLIAEGIKHKGFSLIDIYQPCVAWDKTHGYAYYQEKTFDLATVNHDVTNKQAALKMIFDKSEKLPIGIFYKEEREVYEDEQPQFKRGPLAHRDIENINIKAIFDQYSF